MWQAKYRDSNATGEAAAQGLSVGAKSASRFEIVAARAWNVLNEGKPFTPVFVVTMLVLLGLPHLDDSGYWLRTAVSLVVLMPLFAVFYRFDFPLRLRRALWAYLAAFLIVFRFV